MPPPGRAISARPTRICAAASTPARSPPSTPTPRTIPASFSRWRPKRSSRRRACSTPNIRRSTANCSSSTASIRWPDWRPPNMPELRIAARMQGIDPFHVMDILARAQALEAAGRDIIHLEIGEPDFATPAPIVEAGIAALRAGHTHYTGALGLPALREAIARFYDSRWKVAVDPGCVVVTPGASG